MSPWVIWLLMLSLYEAVASHSIYSNESLLTSDHINELSGRQSPAFFRTMCVGASNTAGVGSSPKDGYRMHLRNRLRTSGAKVNMVGSPTLMAVCEMEVNEGYSGLEIQGIFDQVKKNGYIDRKPNIVLIHAGTNNCRNDHNVADGHEQLANMANWFIDNIPNVLVIMSTLPPLPNQDAAEARCRDVLNPNVRRMVTNMAAQGKNVMLVDIGDARYITNSDIGPDNIHFSKSSGYPKVAMLWWTAIRDAQLQGRIAPPINTPYPDETSGDGIQTCEKKAGDGYGPIQTQFGRAGADDGLYTQTSEHFGLLSGDERLIHWAEERGGAEHIFFAQLFNPSGDKDRNNIQDDLIFYFSGRPEESVSGRTEKPLVGVLVNRGGGQFDKQAIAIDVDDGPGCRTRGVRWGDVNNDGLDDYICIGAEGNMYVSINQGGNPPTFKLAGLYKTAPAGRSQEHVLLGDIDGDGRLDYCVTADNGDITCWRNAGTTEDKPVFWQKMGIIFEGKGMGDIRGTRLVDINGDHRYDWVWQYDDTGRTRIFTNSRGRYDGLKPLWREASKAHVGDGGNEARTHVKFARLFAGAKSGADYVRVIVKRRIESTFPVLDFSFDVWRNVGTGATKLKADGNRYCDMTGKGRDDLLWIRSTGEVDYWSNQNTQGHLSKPWTWGPETRIFNVNRGGGSRDRRGVHFADWDGDGKCDVLYHNRVSGAAEWWKNNYKDGKWDFEYRGDLGFPCKNGIGFGLTDLGLRFADLNNDGRADALCMDPNGRTEAVLNLPGGLYGVGQVKKSEGHERANHRWADVNGDGRADFLWLNNENGMSKYGSTTVQEPSRTKAATGIGFRKANDLDGNKRADLVVINPLTNEGRTWFNLCKGIGSGQDDPDMVEPILPPPPQSDNSDRATCSVDLCTRFPGYCPPDGGDDSFGKRDLESHMDGNLTARGIFPRAGESYKSILANGVAVITAAAPYPRMSRLYGVRNAGQVIKKTFRSVKGYCIGGALTVVSSFTDPTTPGLLTGLQAEHPIDRQIIAEFVESAASGTLRGKPQSSLFAIGNQFFEDLWNKPNTLLGAQPAVGSPDGRSPDTPAGRIMEAFGSTFYPAPFLPTQADINGAKGRIMQRVAPVALSRIAELANAAVKSDTTAAVDELMSSLKIGFAVFDYINTPEMLGKWSLVRSQINTQCRIIENVYGLNNLADWFALYSYDYFREVEQFARDWAEDAILEAARPFLAAAEAGVVLAQGQVVDKTLRFFLEDLIPTMTLP